MLIVGTGGQAIDSFEILSQINTCENLCFFNNIDQDFRFKESFLQKYPLIKNDEDLSQHFKKHPEFILGVGNPKTRKALFDLMIAKGGKPFSLISPKAHIGTFNNEIGEAVTIMNGTVITINTEIGTGTLINTNATVTHDCKIGKFVEIGPGVNIAGACIIKDNVFIGTGANILPKITIGENAVIAAGAVVIKDVPPYTMVAGNPAVVKKKLLG